MSSVGKGQFDWLQILDAVDLVELIGSQVNLKSTGREFVGLCPFHDDHKPSFYVNPTKGIYKCFACGAGGNALKFVQLYFNMERGEAWRYLSEYTGIELPQTSHHTAGQNNSNAPYGQSGKGSSGNRSGSSEDLIDAHRTALSFYRALLKHTAHGKAAREIYQKRGISNEMIERFELGTSPGGGIWDGLVQTLAKKRLSVQPYVTIGLVIAKKSGSGFVDRFRDRLIFPIHDALGRPIAFGGRRIDDADEPKYLNSPEHPKFNKSSTLYGFHLAQKDIRSRDLAVVVEGYTDVIACHQAGVCNVVATLGTSLTKKHTRILQRVCSRVVLVFDGDDAGFRAANRAVEVFFGSTIDVGITILPHGVDPADLVQSSDDGAAVFQKAVDDAVDVMTFLYGIFRNDLAKSGSGISAKQHTIETFCKRLGDLGFHAMTPLRRDLVLSHLGTILDMPRESVAKLIVRPRKRREFKKNTGETPMPPPMTPPMLLRNQKRREEAERSLVGCILCCPALLDEMGDLMCVNQDEFNVSWLQVPSLQQVLRYMIGSDSSERSLEGLLVSDLDESIKEVANDIYWYVSRSGDREDLEVARVECAAIINKLREIRSEDQIAVEQSSQANSDTDARFADIASRIEALRERGGRGHWAGVGGREKEDDSGPVQMKQSNPSRTPVEIEHTKNSTMDESPEGENDASRGKAKKTLDELAEEAYLADAAIDEYGNPDPDGAESIGY